MKTDPGGSLVSSRMPSLDSLRGIAILMVVLFHASQGFEWRSVAGDYWGPVLRSVAYQGAYGVHLFFLLSGFLIGTALLRSREAKGYYRNFYIKRFLRILPVYLVMIVVLKVWMPVSWNFVVAGILFMANYARLFGAHLSEYGSLWSLAVEEHFYLIWPTCVRKLRNRTLVYVLTSIIIGEPLLRVAAVHISSAIDVTYKTTFVLDNIAYGALLATLIHMGWITRANARKYGLIILAVSVPLTVGVAWIMAFRGSPTEIALRSLPWVWMCAGALLLGLHRDALSPGPGRRGGILPFFGYISYGLYLVNQFMNEKVGGIVTGLFRPEARNSFAAYTVRGITCIGTAVVVAYLSRRYFEAPMLALKDRLTGHPELQKEEIRVPSRQQISIP